MPSSMIPSRWWIGIAAGLVLALLLGSSWVVKARADRRAALLNAPHLSTAATRQTTMRFVLRSVLSAQRDHFDSVGSFASELSALRFDRVPGISVTLLQVSGDTLVIQAEDVGRRDRCHVWLGGYREDIKLEDWGEGDPACLDSVR